MKSMTFKDNTLAPIAWVEFSHEHPDQAKASLITTPIPDSDYLMEELTSINEEVNKRLSPKLDSNGWCVWPPDNQGNCTDYVVTKRSELLKNGLPASCLLIADVRTPDNEPHAVLVVRTTSGDWVLDNRNPMVYLWGDVGYQYIRVQSPEDPNMWKTVA